MERHNFRKKYHIPIIGTLNAANLLNIGKKGRRLTQTFSFSLEFAADRIIPSGTMKNVLWGRGAFNGHLLPNLNSGIREIVHFFSEEH